jgi:threonine/homoserine/homoserine lactone efflux protein
VLQAIGEFLPAGVGIAISPIPIVAVVLMLTSARGRVNGPAFLSGWVVGILVVGSVALLAAGAIGGSEDGQPARWVSWATLLLGFSLLHMAYRQFRSRPRGDDEPVTPKWMRALDTFTPAKAAAAGVALSSVNPKNFILIVAGMTAIAQAGLTAGEQAVDLLVFTAIASIGAAVPIFIYFALPARSADLLERLKTWMARNNAVILAAILAVIGAKLVGDAIAGLSA